MSKRESIFTRIKESIQVKRQKDVAVNEFDQVVEGNSLTKDAFRRLKKNKMAMLGMIVIIIYALVAICAGLLPIYHYDEMVIEHKFLAPTLTKTAGELMMEKRYQEIFAKAWKAGRLTVTDEEQAMLKGYVSNSKTNALYAFCYERGMQMLEEGTFTFTSAEKSQLDRLQKSIDEDILVTVNKVTTVQDSKKVNIEKLGFEDLLGVYAGLLNMDPESLRGSVRKDVEAQLKTTLKASNEEATEEDLVNLVAMELDSLGDKGYEGKAIELMLGNINTIITNQSSEIISDSIKSNTAETFPFKTTLTLKSGLEAEVEASKKHSRLYILGTDNLGRDVLSRIIYGGQVSIGIGLVGTVTSIIIGIIFGSIAGYIGGKVDFFIMRFVDILYGLPYMLLVIICMAVFGRNIGNLFFALAMVSWLTIARMVRGQIMSLKNQEYIEAAKSMGASNRRIIFKHLVPNSLSVIIVYSTLRIPAFIMEESFLSFLGLGVQAPYASWGSLVGDAVAGMTSYPWRLVYPALVMTIFLFAMNFFGDGLRDAFDPQSKNML